MASKANIVIDQGADFATTVDVTDNNNEPISLVGYTGVGQLRKHYTSSNAVSFGVSFSNTNVGVIDLTLSASASANMSPGRYVYDVEITSSANVVTRIVEGIATITPQVTR